jgi:hypothetical protein
VLSRIAPSYQKLKKTAEAKRVITQALEMAAGLEEPKQRCDALISIAANQAEVDKNAAGETLEKAVQGARDVDDLYRRCYVLMDAAEVLSKLKRHKRTHEVLKMAEQTAQEIGRPDLQQQTVEKVRELMGKLPKPA